jgi:hypothetical protein
MVERHIEHAVRAEAEAGQEHVRAVAPMIVRNRLHEGANLICMSMPQISAGGHLRRHDEELGCYSPARSRAQRSMTGERFPDL